METSPSNTCRSGRILAPGGTFRAGPIIKPVRKRLPKGTRTLFPGAASDLEILPASHK